MSRGDAVGLSHGGGQYVAGRSGNGSAHGGVDRRADAALVQHARESDNANQSLDGDERDHKCQGTSVTETIRYAHPLKGVLREATPTGTLEHRPRVVTGQTTSLGNECGATHSFSLFGHADRDRTGFHARSKLLLCLSGAPV